MRVNCVMQTFSLLLLLLRLLVMTVSMFVVVAVLFCVHSVRRAYAEKKKKNADKNNRENCESDS